MWRTKVAIVRYTEIIYIMIVSCRGKEIMMNDDRSRVEGRNRMRTERAFFSITNSDVEVITENAKVKLDYPNRKSYLRKQSKSPRVRTIHSNLAFKKTNKSFNADVSLAVQYCVRE